MAHLRTGMPASASSLGVQCLTGCHTCDGNGKHDDSLICIPGSSGTLHERRGGEALDAGEDRRVVRDDQVRIKLRCLA